MTATPLRVKFGFFPTLTQFFEIFRNRRTEAVRRGNVAERRKSGA